MLYSKLHIDVCGDAVSSHSCNVEQSYKAVSITSIHNSQLVQMESNQQRSSIRTRLSNIHINRSRAPYPVRAFVSSECYTNTSEGFF